MSPNEKDDMIEGVGSKGGHERLDGGGADGAGVHRGWGGLN